MVKRLNENNLKIDRDTEILKNYINDNENEF